MQSRAKPSHCGNCDVAAHGDLECRYVCIEDGCPNRICCWHCIREHQKHDFLPIDNFLEIIRFRQPGFQLMNAHDDHLKLILHEKTKFLAGIAKLREQVLRIVNEMSAVAENYFNSVLSLNEQEICRLVSSKKERPHFQEEILLKHQVLESVNDYLTQKKDCKDLAELLEKTYNEVHNMNLQCLDRTREGMNTFLQSMRSIAREFRPVEEGDYVEETPPKECAKDTTQDPQTSTPEHPQHQKRRAEMPRSETTFR